MGATSQSSTREFLCGKFCIPIVVVFTQIYTWGQIAQNYTHTRVKEKGLKTEKDL